VKRCTHFLYHCSIPILSNDDIMTIWIMHFTRAFGESLWVNRENVTHWRGRSFLFLLECLYIISILQYIAFELRTPIVCSPHLRWDGNNNKKKIVVINRQRIGMTSRKYFKIKLFANSQFFFHMDFYNLFCNSINWNEPHKRHTNNIEHSFLIDFYTCVVDLTITFLSENQIIFKMRGWNKILFILNILLLFFLYFIFDFLFIFSYIFEFFYSRCIE